MMQENHVSTTTNGESSTPQQNITYQNGYHHNSNQPRAVVVVKPDDDSHTFSIDTEALEKLLMDPRVADKKVAVISVAGAFRKGKSFLLNFLLRYLNYYQKHHNDEFWLESSQSLDGFSWRGGVERDTSGILVWSEPFLMRDKNGEEIVVILMDTQGAFDSMSTVRDCATIFALSTMISSVQIFNISQNIQEDDLQHLQLFTEYGRLALEDNNSVKPFQTLAFVVRDWSYPYDADYGWMGGQRIIEKRLQTSEKQHPELQQLRNHIKSSFEHIKCFLMPHPGLEVATSPEFRGELKYIHPEFKAQLGVFVPRLFDPNNLVVKSINGQPVTCRELLIYFKTYAEVFQGEELPEPKSMLTATAEANNLAAVASAKALYMREMEEVCGGDQPFLNSVDLQIEHNRCRGMAITSFKSAKKMGGTELSAVFLDRLEEDIQEAFGNFVKTNNSKNLFKSMRTPAVLVGLMIASYFFQEFFQLLGIETIAAVFSLFLTAVIAALSVWVYSRYSGKWRDAQTTVDEAVKWLWDNILHQLVSSGVSPVASNLAMLNRLNEFQQSATSMAEGKKRN